HIKYVVITVAELLEDIGIRSGLTGQLFVGFYGLGILVGVIIPVGISGLMRLGMAPGHSQEKGGNNVNLLHGSGFLIKRIAVRRSPSWQNSNPAAASPRARRRPGCSKPT